MKVSIDQLQEGCILSDDVKSISNRPIMVKGTVLNENLLNILHIFLVESVKVDTFLVNGELFKPTKPNEEKIEEQEEKALTFIDHYLQVVTYYKKMFTSWQAGSSVDIGDIRKHLLPLLERFLENPSSIFLLHQHSTKEDYLYHHGVTVSLLAGFLGKQLHYSQGDWIQIALAGFLCDCGMAKINPKILRKQSSLTEEERLEVNKHPEYSYKMVEKIGVLKKGVKEAVLQHHIREDGTGYPVGILKGILHPFSKIIAVADVYHAMTSEREYKAKQSPFVVMDLIIQDSFGKLDTNVVHALTKIVTNYAIGQKVKLSNGYTGKIVFVEEKNPTRPMVNLFKSNEIIQLKDYRDVYIEEVIL
ncbi:HD-GYP domain-containing protein [Cytobacillus sp. Hm23]